MAKAKPDAATAKLIFQVPTILTAPFALAAVPVGFAEEEDLVVLTLVVSVGVADLVGGGVKMEFDPEAAPPGGGTADDGSARAPTPHGIGSPFV